MAAAASLVTLFISFLWVGALGFGGGFGMIPLMQAVTLRHHWLTPAGFAQAVALGQITPGPVAISATFIGGRVAGVAGAVAATVAVFTPPAVAMGLLLRWYDHMKRLPWVPKVMAATLAAVIGLIAAVTVELGWRLTPRLPALALAAAVAAATRRWRLPYWAVVAATGLIGAVWWHG